MGRYPILVMQYVLMGPDEHWSKELKRVLGDA